MHARVADTATMARRSRRRLRSRILLHVVAASGLAADVAGTGSLVFEHAGTLSLDGETCALRSEGAAASLPLHSDSYTLHAEILTDFLGVGNKYPAIMSWGEFTTNEVNAVKLTANGDGIMNYWFSNDLQSDPSTKLHLTDGQWHQIAATWDGTTHTLVVDGQEVASRKPATKPDVSTKANFCIGEGSPLFDSKWRGKIRCVQIWSVAQSLGQLQNSGCGAWGGTVLWAFAILAVGYLAGGMAWGHRTGAGHRAAHGGPGGASWALRLHPHYSQFVELNGLIQDGVRYSRQRLRGQRPSGGGSRSRPAADGPAQGLLGTAAGDRGSGRSSKHSSKKKKKEKPEQADAERGESQSQPRDGAARDISGSSRAGDSSAGATAPQQPEATGDQPAKPALRATEVGGSMCPGSSRSLGPCTKLT
jgi:hypothetical protein